MHCPLPSALYFWKARCLSNIAKGGGKIAGLEEKHLPWETFKNLTLFCVSDQKLIFSLNVHSSIVFVFLHLFGS